MRSDEQVGKASTGLTASDRLRGAQGGLSPLWAKEKFTLSKD
jgi:hypothetical protein